MKECTDETGFVSKLDDMALLELVDLWDDPMTDENRIHLVDELRARDYCMKSLPEPPLPNAVFFHVSEPLEEYRRRRGVGVILLVGILQILAGTLLGYFGYQDYAEQIAPLKYMDATEQLLLDGEMMSAENAYIYLGLMNSMDAVFALLLGGIFILLYRWGRSRPLPSLWIAFILFLGLQFVKLFALDPTESHSSGPKRFGIVIGALLLFGVIGATVESKKEAAKSSSG